MWGQPVWLRRLCKPLPPGKCPHRALWAWMATFKALMLSARPRATCPDLTVPSQLSTLHSGWKTPATLSSCRDSLRPEAPFGGVPESPKLLLTSLGHQTSQVALASWLSLGPGMPGSAAPAPVLGGPRQMGRGPGPGATHICCPGPQTSACCPICMTVGPHPALRNR